ncbi:MAG: glucose-6-phosphate isomerase [Candidatus Nanopelagicaceae bacterium]|nr:glucose-6-phosphate isomerase [Candidatus Nanopelagicaceae bacterium]
MISIRGPLTSKIDSLDPRFTEIVAASARLAKKDPTLWGKDAETEAKVRLNWVDLPSASRALLPELDALAAKFRNFDRVILCGMGGSSLAPEVIAATFKKSLLVIDSTDPHYISRALEGDLAKSVVIVSSKSGSTIETAAQRALFESRLISEGLDPTDHMVIVTDPGSPLDKDARAHNFHVVNADPHVGGRFSALTAFGLVPAVLLGIDVSTLLDSADDVCGLLSGPQSPAVAVAYLMSYKCGQYFAMSDFESGMPGLSDWIEQLIAESTGKNETGRLPVVIEGPDSPIGSHAPIFTFAGNGDLVVEADLGAQFIFWEWVTALVGFALEIDPFNQPNVTEAKERTSSLLQTWSGGLPHFAPLHTEDSVEIFSNATSVQEALIQLVNLVASDGYISIMAYLDRLEDAALGELRSILAKKSSRPVTFGWGPRFLHSTGQFHKGGQQNGVFLQITGSVENDIMIPGRDFSFATLITAQALGDGAALSSRQLPVVRLHLTNRTQGIAQVLAAARAII